MPMRTILETSRLLLREMSEGDTDNIYRLNSSPKVMRYLAPEPILKNREEALELLRERIIPQYGLHGVGRWAVLLREGDTFIGYAGLKYLPEQREYDLGYRFLDNHWGHGYATEAAAAVLSYGRLHLAGRRIAGKAFVQNLASIHVLEKIGMKFEGYEPYKGGTVAVYTAT